MKQATDRTRNYDKADDIMLEQGQTMHDIFIEDKDDFIAKVTTFKDPFGADFQTTITDAESMPADSEIQAYGTLYKTRVDKFMEEGRKALSSLYFYVKNAFDNNRGILAIFGHDIYEKERSNEKGVRDLLEQAYRSATNEEFKQSLIDLGFVQTDIDNLSELHNSLAENIRLKEEAYKKRLRQTQERVEKLNKVWDFMEKISDASKIIFMDSPTKIEQYLLYPEGRYAKKTKDEKSKE